MALSRKRHHQAVAEAGYQLEGQVYSGSRWCGAVPFKLENIRVSVTQKKPPCLGLPALVDLLGFLCQDEPAWHHSVREVTKYPSNLFSVRDELDGVAACEVLDLQDLGLLKHQPLLLIQLTFT